MAYERDSEGFIKVGGWLAFVLLVHLALDASLWVWALLDWDSLRRELASSEIFDGAVAGAFWAWGTVLFFSRGPGRRHARRVVLAAPLVSLAVELFGATVTGLGPDALTDLLVTLGLDGAVVAYLLRSARTRDTLHSHRPGPPAAVGRDTAGWCSGLLGAALVLGCLPYAAEGGLRLLLPVAALALVALFHVAVSAIERPTA